MMAWWSGATDSGFVKQADGSHLKIPQLADVCIEDDVEIGANIDDRSTGSRETRIRAGTKIDNLVQIAHGVAIRSSRASRRPGRNRREHGGGDDVVLAGQVGVSGHLRIGKGVVANCPDRNSGTRSMPVSTFPVIQRFRIVSG